jgi:hypothetical protein
MDKKARKPRGSRGTKRATTTSRKSAEVAFYYPGPVWYSGEWIKNLLLFFDGIALLVPEHLRDKPLRVDPVVAEPLMDAGLLHLLKPENILDKEATQHLADALVPILESGALDQLSKDGIAFDELSYSRLGSYGDLEVARDLLNRLKTKGLARDSEDGLSIPMHPMARALVLVLLSQILKSSGSKFGLDLWPATDRPELVQGLVELLSLPSLPSKGQVVSFDLETVGVDLTRVPMDEVLGFRKDYGKEYGSYARALRKYLGELSQLSEPQRKEALADRRAEITQMAHDLQDRSAKAWRSPASLAFGLAGAIWTLKTGDLVGAILAAASVGLGASSSSAREVGAYSYLFRVREQHGRKARH